MSETIAPEQEATDESATEGTVTEEQQEAGENTPPIEGSSPDAQPVEPEPAKEQVSTQPREETETANAGGAKTPTTAKPAALTQLVVSSRGDTLRIFAATGTQPKYTTFRLDRPNRLVVDMPGPVCPRLKSCRSSMDCISSSKGCEESAQNAGGRCRLHPAHQETAKGPGESRPRRNR